MSIKKTPKALFNNTDLARQIITTHQLKAVTSLFTYLALLVGNHWAHFTRSNSVWTLSEGCNSSIWTIPTSLQTAACGDALIDSSSQLQDTNRITFLFFSSMTALHAISEDNVLIWLRSNIFFFSRKVPPQRELW